MAQPYLDNLAKLITETGISIKNIKCCHREGIPVAIFFKIASITRNDKTFDI